MSRHEALLGNFTFCKDFKFHVIQASYLLFSICIAWSFINFTSESISIIAMKGDEKFRMIVAKGIFLPFLQLVCLLSCIHFAVFKVPEYLTLYTLVTSCEMMKDRQIIEDVIKEMKSEKTERNFRILQAMRLMRREYMKMFNAGESSEDASSDTGDEMNPRSADTVMT